MQAKSLRAGAILVRNPLRHSCSPDFSILEPARAIPTTIILDAGQPFGPACQQCDRGAHEVPLVSPKQVNINFSAIKDFRSAERQAL